MAIPSKPKNKPITDAPKARKFNQKDDCQTPITIKKGATAPKSTSTKPTKSRYLGLRRFIMQPTCHKMARFILNFNRVMHITNALDYF